MPTEPMNLVLLSSLACDLEPVLRRKLTTPWNLVRLTDAATADEVAGSLLEADAVLTLRYTASCRRRGCASCRSPAPATTASISRRCRRASPSPTLSATTRRSASTCCSAC
jgi:hypothetical protein